MSDIVCKGADERAETLETERSVAARLTLNDFKTKLRRCETEIRLGV